MCELPKDYPRNICAYCGTSENLLKDRDHVPPKNLFPRPRPNNLITVAACKNCHTGTSKDDEYFRIKLCLRDDAGNHSSARANWDSIFRSLKRDEAAGLKKSFLSDLHNIHLYTPSGLYAGKGVAYDVDLERLRKVAERTIRGLYFAESKQPLGLNNEVHVYCNEDLELQPPKVLDQLKLTILNPIATKCPKVIGNNIFLYRHQIMEENPIFSVWVVSFYGKVPFFGMTGPQRNKNV